MCFLLRMIANKQGQSIGTEIFILFYFINFVLLIKKYIPTLLSEIKIKQTLF